MNISFYVIFRFFRAIIGILIMIHGVARTYYQTIDNFGAFLNDQGFVIGYVIAYGITFFEILGGILIILNLFSKWIAPLFAVELIIGIILVHSRSGWFVVGHGTNGVEYSIALIVSLILIWAEDFYKPLKKLT